MYLTLMTDRLKSVVLTGFMGVGKSSVARHLSPFLGCQWFDLDSVIEKAEGRTIADIIDKQGIDAYRRIETRNLKKLLSETDVRLLSLGGGTWTLEENRAIIRDHGFTSVWLESTFEHCWRNIRKSRKERPLARDKAAARKLFDDRQTVYCLSDWHFIVRPGSTSYDVAKEIVDQVFS
jgi:shikimate kinase